MRIDNSIPIEVGSKLRDDFIYSLKDDVGDNISLENPYYGELTGLYWIWKNYKFNEDDLVGFCNYNKTLKINKDNIKSLVDNKCEWITFEPIKIVAHSKINEIRQLEIILENNYPEYYKTWKELYNHDGSSKYDNCRYANTFLTTYEELDKYCSFLFPILKELRTYVGNLDHVRPNDKRYCAYIAERLLSVYLLANNKKAKSTEMIYKQWHLNIVNRLNRKFRFNKNSFLYKKLKSKFGYKSSYKNK